MNILRIGIDIMGGDKAPAEIVKGAILASNTINKNIKLVLFGDSVAVKTICEQNDFNPEVFEIVHTTETIEMHDHSAKAFQTKTDSSITKGFEYLATQKIDAFASAGNTGAMLVGAMMIIKPIEGIIRPCLSTLLPKTDGKDAILLDIGINPDCKPEVLLQWGIIGSVFAKEVYKIENPKVALLNVGTEEGKGNLLARTTYGLMKESRDINFIGNIEGSDLFRPEIADVVVTDGFTGNIVLKQSEMIYRLAQKRGIDDDYFNRFNFELYGGTPILGINKPVIVGHGVSKASAIKNMIINTINIVETNLTAKIATQVMATKQLI
ncbi:MAG TPA: phosphate acyltransferase PlsX [Salinivirgaceae bacterium]|nr:phosphate acyltransferase PlsX [Salinivirgaceae bacterium]